jgi:hypothetical protein
MGLLPTSDAGLDAILALQISVAWAGEARSQPKRLGWWQTDLADDAGGADLFARLTPRTHAWVTLEALREAARRVDDRTRRRSGAPDRLVTLYRLGFELDERLDERLGSHKARGISPERALPAPVMLGPAFDRAAFEAWARGLAPPPATEDTPEGRRLRGNAPTDPVQLVR